MTTRHIKIDPVLDAKIAKLAKNDRRTLHNMLQVLLAEAVANRQKDSK